MAYEWENSTLEQKKAKLEELKAKLAQAKMDSEYRQQRGGLTRAAEAMMQYDPMGAFNLLDKREALDVKRQQVAASTSGKKVLLDEIKAMNWSVQNATNPSVKQQLSDNLEELNKQYLAKYGVTPEQDMEKDPVSWLSDYWDKIAIPSYGVNEDGTIKNSSKLKDDIKRKARAEGFSVLDKDIDAKIDGHNADAQRAYGAKTGKQAFELSQAKSGEEFSQTKYENWLKNTIPGIDKASNELSTLSQGFASAKAQGERSPIGGAYIAMKKSLGDALSNADFSGIAGFGVGQGLISKFKSALGASAMTEAQAKDILTTAIQGYNDMVDLYNRSLDEKTRGEPSNYVSKAKKAYGVQKLTLPTFSKNKDESAGKGLLRGGKKSGSASDLDKELGL